MTQQETIEYLHEIASELDVEITSVVLSDQFGTVFPDIGFLDGMVVFNSVFMNLPEGEMRFATMMHLVPRSKEKLPRTAGAILALSVVVSVIGASFENLSTLLGLGPAILLCLGVWYANHDARLSAKRLEALIILSKDPISARSYLVRRFGPVYPPNSFRLTKSSGDNPISNYLAYGKDDRLKAILRSDLSHPDSGQSPKVPLD
jgi:hypothetical protein